MEINHVVTAHGRGILEFENILTGQIGHQAHGADGVPAGYQRGHNRTAAIPAIGVQQIDAPLLVYDVSVFQSILLTTKRTC